MIESTMNESTHASLADQRVAFSVSLVDSDALSEEELENVTGGGAGQRIPTNGPGGASGYGGTYWWRPWSF